MNIFLLLLGIAFVLCGIGVLLSLVIRALGVYRQQLDDPALDDWADWDAYEGGHPEIAEAKKRWWADQVKPEAKPKKKAKKK